jgi:hypothetical protein
VSTPLDAGGICGGKIVSVLLGAIDNTWYEMPDEFEWSAARNCAYRRLKLVTLAKNRLMPAGLKSFQWPVNSIRENQFRVDSHLEPA